MNPPFGYLSRAIAKALEGSGKPMTIAQLTQVVGKEIPTPQAISRYKKRSGRYKVNRKKSLQEQARLGRQAIVGTVVSMMARRGAAARVVPGVYAAPLPPLVIYSPPAEAG